ncbi:SDR family oxidoreductase [Sphingomonas sp. DT-51]|uniref:SDR family oxidoreductase n=1 Tax=Sphingomonas sp. DT-51 TaxID=3396165 RepID=UPI003F19BC8C
MRSSLTSFSRSFAGRRHGPKTPTASARLPADAGQHFLSKEGIDVATLEGRKVLVTGASRGIGAAIVRRLAEEGADVALTYQASADAAETVAAEIRALDRKAVVIRSDSADAAQVKASVTQAVEELGGLYVLVNNAGIARGGPLTEMSLEDIEAILDVNVKSVIVASQVAIPHLKGGGRIINIGSCLAERVLQTNVAVYSASKSALLALTQALARDLGEDDIAVTVVHPGPTDTDMNPADGPGAESQRANIALGRYGTAEDVAATVAFLAGPGGRHINGTGITVDGGLNA